MITPSNTPQSTPHDTPSTTPSITPSESPIFTPSITPSTTPYKTPESTPYSTPSSTPSIISTETPKSISSIIISPTTSYETPISTAYIASYADTPINTPQETVSKNIKSLIYVPTPRWTVKPTQSPYFDGYAGLPYDPNPIKIAIKETQPPLPTEFVPHFVGHVKKVVNIASGTIILIVVIVLTVLNLIRSAFTVKRTIIQSDNVYSTDEDSFYSLTITVSQSEYSNYYISP